jgi:hypothetical protein
LDQEPGATILLLPERTAITWATSR